MVLPNGPLFADGVAARIKQELLRDFNLHTIVRLPNGVFAPYTSIPTNLLFFQRALTGSAQTASTGSAATQEIWYYELPLPEGRAQYTKTRPLKDEEFDACRALWDDRPITERSWRVPLEQVAANNYNLDIKNPAGQNTLAHRLPEELVESILAKEQRIAEIMGRIKQVLGRAEL
jgi:type I restriction enzyme M protein